MNKIVVKTVGFALSVLLMTGCATVDAAKKNVAKKTLPKIVFVPHDNRPVSDKQTAEVVRSIGEYELVVPPDQYLGSRDDLGDPDKLWEWLEANADDAEAAVVSVDAMLYGSLVGSRKHQFAEKDILARAEKFRTFRVQNPALELYAFGSIMRTPINGEASGHEEPEYYQSYGADIFRYTVLKDKQELEGLNRLERKEYAFLSKLIPKEVLSDWYARREKNFAANKKLIDLVRNDTFNYFILGRDDNAPLSQTHLESRHLGYYGHDLSRTRFLPMAGIDEIGMILLARAVNDNKNEVPFVYVEYNRGKGERTIPSYSDEPIGQSVTEAITATGAMRVTEPNKADLVLLVNTNPNGKTGEANWPDNDGKPREGSTDYFAGLVENYVVAGYPVGVADVAFANGADNALMEALKNRGLLFKLKAYGGWNTATNSTGFLIGAGQLTKYMSNDAADNLLVTRYLDDWAYQANVRTVMARQLTWLRGDGVYGTLADKRAAVQSRATSLMRHFAENNLPPFAGSETFTVAFPWNRMFESDVRR